MPIYLQINTGAYKNVTPMSGSGRAASIPAMQFTISLNAKTTLWHVEKPFPAMWRYILPDGMGTWTTDMASTIILKCANKTVFELRSSDQGSGSAFFWQRQQGKGFMAGTFYDGEGIWSGSAAVPLRSINAGSDSS